MIAPILFAVNAHKEVVWETCVQWSCYRTGLGKEAPVDYLMGDEDKEMEAQRNHVKAVE